MLVPTDGFGWVIGDHKVAPPGQTECVITVGAATAAAVEEMIERAGLAGAKIVSGPAQQPWGYTGTFADPDDHLWMVTAQPLA